MKLPPLVISLSLSHTDAHTHTPFCDLSLFLVHTHTHTLTLGRRFGRMALHRLTTRWRPDATVGASDPIDALHSRKKKKIKNGLEGKDEGSGGGGLGPGYGHQCWLLSTEAPPKEVYFPFTFQEIDNREA